MRNETGIFCKIAAGARHGHLLRDDAQIFHVHLHVFPRFRGDRLRIDADGSNPPSREAPEPAGHIRAAIASAGG